MFNNTKNNNQDNFETLVYGHKLSSVGPSNISGNDTIYEPNNIDLAMKLHYIKVVYFLDNKAAEGLTLRKIKECTFSWLNYYYESCGRFRRFENGRPYIKCNDCGVRCLEAQTSKTLQQWLLMEDDSCDRHALLVPQNHVLGPELTFSPLVFIQVTFFKCGGLSLGISWAHVLGDAFSVSNYMNNLAQFLNGHPPNYPPPIKKSPPIFPKPIEAVSPDPLSVNNVGPVGDLWIKPTSCEMDTFSFHVTQIQLAQLQMKLSGSDQSVTRIQPFEALCGIIWHAIAKIRVGPKPNIVTIVKKDGTGTGPIEDIMVLRNNQVVGSITLDFSVEEAHPKDLATLILDWAHDERAQISELVDRDPGTSDLIVYGSKLTFVDLEDANFYGFVIKGLSPKFVHCFVDGIGEEGVVLVLPAPRKGDDIVDNVKGETEGRIVTLTLPKSYMAELKEELKREWDLIV